MRTGFNSLIGSQDLAVKSRPNLFTHFTGTPTNLLLLSTAIVSIGISVHSNHLEFLDPSQGRSCRRKQAKDGSGRSQSSLFHKAGLQRIKTVHDKVDFKRAHVVVNSIYTPRIKTGRSTRVDANMKKVRGGGGDSGWKGDRRAHEEEGKPGEKRKRNGQVRRVCACPAGRRHNLHNTSRRRTSNPPLPPFPLPDHTARLLLTVRRSNESSPIATGSVRSAAGRAPRGRARRQRCQPCRSLTTNDKKEGKTRLPRHLRRAAGDANGSIVDDSITLKDDHWSLSVTGAAVGTVVRPLTSPEKSEPCLIPGGTTPASSHVGIVPDDAAGRRVFSGSSVCPTLAFRRYSTSTSLHTLIGSQDLIVKGNGARKPYIYTNFDPAGFTEEFSRFLARQDISGLHPHKVGAERRGNCSPNKIYLQSTHELLDKASVHKYQRPV
ncbi:hypothetical protein PR048_026234 [Dryococelus australis]|uniref:Uncharacterized protein n=1 Tax=Dryococelus australis TaxID=614101 RepID=A0ABQ9GKS0_9NEOP|nr:hypothetical protein PR048_026234 [Dryococelus australis]